MGLSRYKSKKENIDYSKINRKELPPYLQNKTDKESKNYVEEQKKICDKISLKINELNKKRTAFIADKQIESMKKNELESVMIRAIKKQTMKKNFLGNKKIAS